MNFKHLKNKIEIDRARQMLIEVLSTSGAVKKDIETMAFMLMEYDFHDNTFSGFEKIESRIQELKTSIGKEYKIVVDKPSMKLVDGNGRSARLVGMDVVEMVSDMAKNTGIGLVGIYNSNYHGILETYSRAIAANDLIAIVSANGGPQGVVPFGGRKDIFGTNPISYAFPALELPVVFDAATAKYAYGSIGLAKERGETLAERSYFDKEGNFTTDPNKAYSIIPFGEHKGYAINLMLDIMTGIMVRAKSGLDCKEESDLGAFFIAIDPGLFVPIDEFKSQVSKLVKDIENTEPFDISNPVQVPGFRGEKLKQKMLDEGFIYIDKNVWDKFESVYKKLINGIKGIGIG